MRAKRMSVLAMMLATLLSGCGGGGGGGASTATTTATTAPASGTVTTAGTTCSLRDRQDWAASQLKEWYLFPETLPASLDPTPYANVPDYVDALTATARSQRKDRYFTYLTSIAAENAYYDSGSSAGFGIRLSTDAVQRRAFVTEAFEGAPALAAGIDRGAEIVAIGNTPQSLRTVSDMVAASGTAAVSDALGPSTAGTTRTLRIASGGATRDVTITKTDYALLPVSSRYGSRILQDAGRQVGYINLRTFISTADPALRAAFLQFRQAGITDFVVDLRYNGGGLVSIAALMGSLLGGNRAVSDVFAYTSFRPEKAANNSTDHFAAQPQSTSPVRIAFIGTGGTASASELVINAFPPFLHAKAGLIGTNTYGKPVGQIALDRTACDDRLRVIAFATSNAARTGGYYDGLAGVMEASCQAKDDLAYQLGDPQEASLAQALGFLDGRSCAAIPTGAVAQAASGEGRRLLLSPDRPDTAQREVPGLY